jgi:hypothetical protein
MLEELDHQRQKMDEGGSRMPIEGGVLKIWDQQRYLFAWVQRTENCMYRESHVPDDEAWWWHE